MPLVDVARLHHALNDRARTHIGVIDHRAPVHLHGRPVRQHARGIEGQRIAVAAVGRLGRALELLGERRLEEVDLGKIEHVEPQHRLLRGIAMIVRRPVGGNDEIAGRHVGLLALDCSVGALAVEHEADRRGDVPVRGRDLARQDHLHAGKQGIGGFRLALERGIFQD